MTNQVSVSTDDVCVYVTASIRNRMAGKVVLAVANAIVLSILILSGVMWIPGLFIVSILLVAFMLRFTLWTLFGQERLIINTKSIVYQLDYGFFKTPYKTMNINGKLKILAQPSKSYEDEELQLSFVTYTDEGPPLRAYNMSIAVTKHDVIIIEEMVHHLYLTKMTEQFQLPGINLN